MIGAPHGTAASGAPAASGWWRCLSRLGLRPKHSSLFLPLSQAPLLFGIFEAPDRIDRNDPCCFLDLGFPGFERLGLLSCQIIETLASHWLDHQFAERPDKRVTSIGREPCRGAVEIGGEGAHLIFQCREGADVVNAATGSALTTLPRDACTAL